MTAPDSTLVAADLDWLTLENGEDVLWAGGPDRRTMISTLIIGIPLSLVIVGIPMIIGSYLWMTNTHYVVTTRGVYAKTGILSRDVNRIDFEKIQNISYKQGAIGTQFGYGTVEISTAGSGGVEMTFRTIPNPRSVQELISSRLERQSAADSDDDRPPEEVLTDILTELRAIRSHLEQSGGHMTGGNVTAGNATGQDTVASDEPSSTND